MLRLLMGLAYTRWERATGCGKDSVPHLGNHIWPDSNEVLGVAIDDSKVDNVLNKVGELKKELPYIGVKAFVVPIEQIV